MVPVTIEQPESDPSSIDELRHLWVELQCHQLEVATYQGLNHDLEAGWSARRTEYADALTAGGALIRARRGDALVGYCALRLHPGPDSTWSTTGIVHVITLVVAPDARGAGIGGDLLDAAAAFAVAHGADVLELEVMPGNENARRLYDRSGFEAAEVVLHRRLS